MQQRRSPRLAASNGSSPATNGTNGHYTNGKAAKSKVMNELTDTGENILQKLWNRTISPLFLICTCPNAVLLLWYTAVHCNGSYLLLGQELMRKGVFTGLAHIWGKVNFFSPLAAGVILGYGLFAMFLQVTMPGPRAEGPVTPHGNTPVYKDNGFTCYVVTMISFCALTYYLKSNGMTPTIIYDHFEEFLGTLTVGSMIFCVGLYLKGLLAPSTTDSGSSGNPIFDYYWGTELYPRVFGVDIKVFTNCRFGMTVWPLLVLIFSLKSYELYGFVDSAWISCFLHFVYFTKFFWWEIGYMGTIDIMVDRAGYYICWGCMVFIPGMYAVTSLYLVNHPVHLGLPLGLLITVLGFASTVINYWADLQKQQVGITFQFQKLLRIDILLRTGFLATLHILEIVFQH